MTVLILHIIMYQLKSVSKSMHVFFINEYQTEFTESIDKTYINIFLKYGLLNFHDTFPYLSPKAGFQESQVDRFTYSSLIILNQV